MNNKTKVAINTALKEIKDGKRLDNHGICLNLLLKLESDDEIENAAFKCSEFTYSRIRKFFGSYSMYPIEGGMSEYSKNDAKWEPSNKHGATRLKLLDFMIKESE